MSRGPRRVRCPAKVNLMLEVLGRRSDGYHELSTVFQAVGIWDRLTIRDADVLTLTCDDPSLPIDDSNLVLQAARRLARACGRPARGALHLEKSIPAQAGLGGGSSDAAGTLILCASFWGLEEERGQLADLAAGLGADVPYFLVGGTALGLGRGDRIRPLEPLPEMPIVVGKPAFGISTAEVFGRVARRLTLPANGVNLPAPRAHKWLAEKDFSVVRDSRNDLEEVVFEGWPELERFREGLSGEGAVSARLSGSGSAVFGLFESAAGAEAAATMMRGRFAGWTVLTSRTVDGGVRLEPTA